MIFLPLAVFGQTGDKILDEISNGQIKAIHATVNSLPQKDGIRYIVSDNDTVWEKNDAIRFFQAVISKAFAENTVKRVCGVFFGDAYDHVRNTLERTFGSPVYVTKDNIQYKNIVCGEDTFDDASFSFLFNGRKDMCLNQIILIKNANNLKDAIQEKNRLHERLSKGYSSILRVDDKLTVGGLPPAAFMTMKKVGNPTTTAEMGFGFEIKIIPPKEARGKFLVRLLYGPFSF